MNTDTYQNALESTKDSIEDVNSAIGFSLGNLTLEKLITSAITLVICVLVIWLVMRVARRISAHSRLSESLSRCILKVLKFALSGAAMTGTEIAVLVVGCVVAFAVSMGAIRFLMDYVKRHNFKFFGVYRIVLGLIVLAVAAITAIA